MDKNILKIANKNFSLFFESPETGVSPHAFKDLDDSPLSDPYQVISFLEEEHIIEKDPKEDLYYLTTQGHDLIDVGGFDVEIIDEEEGYTDIYTGFMKENPNFRSWDIMKYFLFVAIFISISLYIGKKWYPSNTHDKNTFISKEAWDSLAIKAKAIDDSLRTIAIQDSIKNLKIDSIKPIENED